MERKLAVLGPLLALVFVLKCASAESVPALLWSNQGHQSPDAESRFNTLVDQVEPDDILGDYAKNKVRVVALVQKDLSVEQFAANDASFVSTIFDNTQSNPVFFANVKSPRKVFSLFKSDNQAANDNVVVYLPGKSLQENDDTIKAYTEKYNATGPVVFMLTGESNEFLKENKRTRREAKKGDDTPTKPKFLSLIANGATKPCLLVTLSSATANLYKKDAKDPEVNHYKNLENLDKTASKCASVKSESTLNRAEKLEIKIDGLVISWDLNTTDASKWEMKPEKVLIGTNEFTIGKNTQISNFKGFSYSCQKAVIPISNSEYVSGSIVLEGFQVQPYYDIKKEGPVRFDDSSDCAVWITLPIFSSLIVVLLLITILYFGVIALMSISTPDRFENPKSGRALIITNFDE